MTIAESDMLALADRRIAVASQDGDRSDMTGTKAASLLAP
jgi:hypothetical protein